MTDRMTVAEAREALEKVGYAAFLVAAEIYARPVGFIGHALKDKNISTISVIDNTVSRASVNELVERAKK